MRFLVIHAHPDPESFNAQLKDAAVASLRAAGHHVDVLDLYASGFRAAMSAEERLAYESPEPILDPQVRAHADLVARADGLVFVYPTWWWGMPAVLKGWLERVMVMGVAFRLDEATRVVRPGLGHISRIVGISTYGSPRWAMRLFNDGGRRLVMRCVRVLCPARARATWLGLYGMDHRTDAERVAFLARVSSKMAAL
jgi:NAD(P)H dehydrogenase (quinone)